MMAVFRSVARRRLPASVMGALALVFVAHHAIAAEPTADDRAAAAARSPLSRDMVTECVQNGLAAVVLGGPVGLSPYVMSALGCGVGALSAIVASGVVHAWEQPNVVAEPIRSVWNTLPNLGTGSVTTDVLAAPLVALASVSDVFGTLFGPVFGQPERPGVMIAQNPPVPPPVPETLMAGHYQPGIGTGWRPAEP